MNIMPIRRDWNAMAPPVPIWFKKKLSRISKDLVLQFIPPDYVDPDGTDSRLHPYGQWQICRKVKNQPNFLHKMVVWCLQDRQGLPSSPSVDTLNIIRLAKYERERQGNNLMLQKEFDNAVREINNSSIQRSKDLLRASIEKSASVLGHRQFQNRIFMR